MCPGSRDLFKVRETVDNVLQAVKDIDTVVMED